MTLKNPKRIFASIGIVLLGVIFDLISTQIEEGHFPEGLLGMAMLPIIGSVIAICWLLRWGWLADEKGEREGSDDELSLPVLVLVWFIKIVFVWPIYWPCWLMYKTVFVAVPTGIVLCGAGAALDNAALALVGFLTVFLLGPIGLLFRLYVWFIYLRFGDPADGRAPRQGDGGGDGDVGSVDIAAYSQTH